MKTSYIAAALLSLVVFSSPAHSALFADDDARKAILELREQLQTQRDVQMQMYERLESLTQEVQALRGQLDNLDNSYRLQNPNDEELEEADQAALAEQAANGKEAEAGQALDAALKLVNKKSYKEAITSLTNFAKNYESSKLMPDALYWLGSSYYGSGNYNRAIEVENRMINSYPSHSMVPEALLILGMAQLDAKKTSAGKATLNNLIKKYPNSDAAKVAKSQL